MHDAGFNTSQKTLVLYAMVFIGAVLVIGNIIAMKKANDYGRREAILFATIPMAIS
jgi:predicted MFS family arabinose efflux permease